MSEEKIADVVKAYRETSPKAEAKKAELDAKLKAEAPKKEVSK